MIDGHGGRAAAEYVAENLGKNIVKELECTKRAEDHQLEALIRRSYSITDKEFLLKVNLNVNLLKVFEFIN